MRKSSLVAQVHDGYKSLDCRTIGTCHDQRAVGIKVGSEPDFRTACLPPGRFLGFFSLATNPVLSPEFIILSPEFIMDTTSPFIVAQLELVMINVPLASKLAPSLTFEQLVCHQDVFSAQWQNPIFPASKHGLFPEVATAPQFSKRKYHSCAQT